MCAYGVRLIELLINFKETKCKREELNFVDEATISNHVNQPTLKTLSLNIRFRLKDGNLNLYL